MANGFFYSVRSFILKLGDVLAGLIKNAILIFNNFVSEVFKKIAKFIIHCQHIVMMRLGQMFTGKTGKVTLKDVPVDCRNFIKDAIEKALSERQDIECLNLNDFCTIAGTDSEGTVMRSGKDEFLEIVNSKNCTFTNQQDAYFNSIMDSEGAIILDQATAKKISAMYS